MSMPDGHLPLISVIMPTRNRATFVTQAMKLYHAQDYPHTELIVVDDSDAPTYGLSLFPDVHYIWLSQPLPIGMKRNIACSLAQGEIICHWDDDDFYGQERLSKQAEPILNGQADFTALRMSLLLDAAQGTLWTCTDMTHQCCFQQDVHYGTLMYKASYWQHGLQYASTQVGEDRRFVHALLAQDARLARIVDPASFIYVLHKSNTTSDMRLVHSEGWTQVPLEDYLPAEYRAFYQSLVTERGSV